MQSCDQILETSIQDVGYLNNSTKYLLICLLAFFCERPSWGVSLAHKSIATY